MARNGFGLRLGYLFWLAHLEEGQPPAYAAVGRAIGEATGADKALTGQAVGGWLDRDEATDSRKNNRALAEHFDVSESWLVDGDGDPPHPALWAEWSKARRRQVRREPPVADEFSGTARKRKDG